MKECKNVGQDETAERPFQVTLNETTAKSKVINPKAVSRVRYNLLTKIT